MKWISVFILMIFLCLFMGLARAQTIVRGTVVDAISRQPLESATVISGDAEGTMTITDQYGNFSIPLSKTVNQLTISSLGYSIATVTVPAKGNIRVCLQPTALNMKDVVVLSNSHVSKFSTLSKIDLDLKPVRNTQQLLSLVPGLFIAQHAGGGKAEQIFLRGFDCDHGTDVQVSVDGMPVNMVSHAHGQGYADAHFIIPETINNVDFGAGPYYTSHGNLNTAGYVSFSTFKSIPRSMIQLEAGRFHSFRTLAMIDLLKKNKDKQSAYIAADFSYTDGPTISEQRFKRLNLFGKYNLAISDHTQLSASVSSFTSRWDASGQVPDRAVKSGMIDRFGSIDPTEGGNTERHNINLNISHRFNSGASWENQAWYSRYRFNLYSNFTFFANDPVNGDGINQAEGRNLFGYLSSLKQQYYFNRMRLNSVYAAGFRYDATSDSRLSHQVKRVVTDDVKRGDIKEANIFAYTQQQLNIGKFLVDAGVRLDHFNFRYFDRLTAMQMPSQNRTIISPKLNVQFTLNKQVQFFIKTGKGFHSNDTRVVVQNAGKEILPAAYGADLGFIVKPNKNLLLTVAAWYLHLDQEFVYVGDEGVVEPSGKSRRQGIDVIARYQLTDHIFANLNLNFTKPRAIGESKGADYIPLAPTLTSVGGLYYKAAKGFNGGLSYRYIKDRPANEDNTIRAKGYFVMDGALNYTRPKYEAGIAIENLFNVKWNEAQFATESRLQGEPANVTELHYTPGTPFFIKVKLAYFF